MLVSEDLEIYQRVPAALSFSNWRASTHFRAGFVRKSARPFKITDKRAVKFDSCAELEFGIVAAGQGHG